MISSCRTSFWIRSTAFCDGCRCATERAQPRINTLTSTATFLVIIGFTPLKLLTQVHNLTFVMTGLPTGEWNVEAKYAVIPRSVSECPVFSGHEQRRGICSAALIG